ncbi:TPA: hypothetical protein LVL79_001106 [Klebsiella oxytoca]|nr:hypothetical protein [Klebsiella oxytoca]
MMKKLYPFLFLPLLISASAAAIGVGEVTSIMFANEQMLAKEIDNASDSARFVSVSAHRLSTPMAGGKIIPMEQPGELLSTPANVILPAGAREHFRFIYHGPEDDKERYYRLSWLDEPVSDHQASSNSRHGMATTSAQINTILVVAPRKAEFNYQHRGDTVTNTGNVTFRVISYGPCKDPEKNKGEGCRERYYVMPGLSAKITHTQVANKQTRIGIWHEGKYIHVK